MLLRSTTAKQAINKTQSNLSRKPPCPGIEFAKSLILKALFTPEAKKPAKGLTTLAKIAMKMETIAALLIVMWV